MHKGFKFKPTALHKIVMHLQHGNVKRWIIQSIDVNKNNGYLINRFGFQRLWT